MYKKDLINFISLKTGISKNKVEELLKAFQDGVIEALGRGEIVSLIGFGTFRCVDTKAKTGRNPRTGKEIKIPAGKKVKFTVGKVLKDSVK